MDRSRSPRNLSDEARLLQRLEEVELPPGATDAERVAARAEAAAAVEQAANEVGEHWARAYQELHPDWQPTDIEVSNQRAAELTAAREQIARLTASISVMRTHITRLEAGIAETVPGHMFYHDEYGALIPLEALETHIPAVTRPFSGEGRRLGDE